MASKNGILEGTRKVAIEAIQSRSSPSRGPRFARNYTFGKGSSMYTLRLYFLWANIVNAWFPIPNALDGFPNF